MKPLRIHMKNIGPFVDEKLDFTQLEEVFLLCGDTGAGKTTIFDAMAFALYGEFLGARKGKAKDFRSQFAKEDEESLVEFEFSSDGGKYRVVRTLPRPYINRNKKADVKSSEVTVEKWNETSKTYEFLNAGKKEIDSILAKIVGLNAPEFSKIVVLPQGEFSEFLRSNSNVKQEILRKLFPVDFYQSIVEKVKEKKDNLQSDIKAAESGLKELLGENDFTDADEKLSSFENQIEENKKAQKKLERQKEKLNKDNAKIEGELKTALELEESVEKLSVLEKKATYIEETEKKLLLSDEAELVVPFIESKNQRKKEVEAAKKYSEKINYETEIAESKFKELESRIEENKTIEKSIDENKILLKSLSDKLDAAEKYDAEFKVYGKLKSDLDVAKDNLKKKGSELSTLETKLEEMALAAGIPSGLESGEIFRLLMEKFSKKKNECQEANELYNQVVKFNGVKKQIYESENAIKKYEADKEGCERQIAAMEKLLAEYKVQKEDQAANNKAVAIVHLLKEGCPCPVCGSTEHPSPVKASKEFLDLDEKISAAEKSMKSESELKSVKSEKIAAEKVLAEKLNSDLAELEKNCKNVSVEEARKKSELLKEEMLLMQGLSEECGKLVKNVESTKKAVLEFKDAVAESEKKCSASEAALKILESQLEKTGGAKNPEEIKSEIKEHKILLDVQQKQVDSFNKEYKDAETNLERCRTKKTEAANSLSAAENKSSEADSVLAEKLEDSKFKDEKEVLDSFVEKKEKAELKKEVSEYKAEVARLKSAVEVLSSKVSEKHCDLKARAEKLEMEIKSMEEKIRGISIALEKLLSEKTSFEKDYLKFKEKTAEIAKLEAEGKPLVQLWNDVSGSNPSKIQFETWFLGLFFDDVVVCANRHLLKISGERYEFKLDANKSGGNSYRGLDLVVHDYQVNKDRDTATLSGGETFMASISLALGLTEVVQKTSRLDSLFIDEGFGSLDKESLEMAVGVLQDIGTTRTVGVISHVEEMLDAIACHVYVKKTRHGSHIVA